MEPRVLNAAIAHIIRARRIEAGLKQEDVCAALSIWRSRYDRIESGKCEIHLSTLDAVAEALGKEGWKLYRDAKKLARTPEFAAHVESGSRIFRPGMGID